MTRFSWILIVAAAVGCGAPAGDTTPVADTAESTSSIVVTPVEFNLAGAPVVELDTPGMHCGACAANICKALKEQPGVVDVKADADTKVVTVAIDDAAFETDAAISAIAEAGFGEAKLIEATTPIEEESDVEDAGEPS